MGNIDSQIAALEAASRNAMRALEATVSDDFAHCPDVERSCWASAAIIHCDIFRYLIAYQLSTSEGVVRLLWMGDIVCTLYEAKKWFFQTGNRNLLDIAIYNGYDVQNLRRQQKHLKNSFPLAGIDAYETFRNKAGHHYDAEFVQHIQSFSQTEFDSFHTVLDNYARYSHEWLKLAVAVIKHGHQSTS